MQYKCVNQANQTVRWERGPAVRFIQANGQMELGLETSLAYANGPLER